MTLYVLFNLVLSKEPSLEPSLEPTQEPSLEPTVEPTLEPEAVPTPAPTKRKYTAKPTKKPTKYVWTKPRQPWEKEEEQRHEWHTDSYDFMHDDGTDDHAVEVNIWQ